MMNKIIQLLRLSRLVLLVILLLFAVAAKIARADTALLYYAGAGNVKGNFFADPLAACQSEFPQSTFVKPYGDGRDAGYCLSVNQANNQVHWGNYSSMHKTCDAKELTNNGRPLADDQDYYDSRIAAHPILSKIIYEKAPDGEDAALWFPDRFSRCQNNCVVRYKRYTSEHIGKSTNERDGTSRSTFFRNQTGEVCVPEPKKKNDPPKPPAPDNGYGADGNGQSSPGSDNGQGQGGNDASGQGSQSGNDSSDNQGSGNSDNSGANGSGSGSGSGGVNGSGGQTGPSGGGTSGGESGGNESEGSEGEAGGESDGSGEESGGSGESGGEGGADSGGQGNVGGNGNNGQNGQPDGTGEGQGDGDGDGQGSISGGSCELNQAPDCKGDPIQCYIAREQWRTACAATGQNSKVEGNGDCKAKRPPECKGDATQCYMVKSRWAEACARAELESYGQGQSSALEKALGEGGDAEGIISDNSSTINLPGQLDTAGFGWARTCPISNQIDLGIFGKHDWLADRFCAIANFVGHFLVLLTLIASARYIL